MSNTFKKKICVIVGTRPEAIKLCPVIILLKNTGVNLVVCSTGQHSAMLEDALKCFNVQADYNLDVMHIGSTLSSLTISLMKKIDELFTSIKPDIVIVHGDTTSAMAASIISFYHKIQIYHIEAGLRTHKINEPYPEEYNRKVIAISTAYHFAPTELAKFNLIKEGVNEADISVTGNTVIDAVRYIIGMHEENPIIKENIINELNRITKINIIKDKYVLVTAHRRENIGEGFKNIFESLQILSRRYPSLFFIYPVHPNPKIKNMAYETLSRFENIRLIDPQNYENFIQLIANSHIILTDSGGIQEEAQYLKKPVLVMREVTERVESLLGGNLKIVGISKNNILSSFTELYENSDLYNQMTMHNLSYGDGYAANKIIEIIKKL